jgi:choice-of-anchor B domain-containing protein
MEPTAVWDTGRDAMQKVMSEKIRQWSEADRCMADGSCPELLMRPLSGAYECDATGIAGDIPCHNIDQLSFLTFEELGYTDPVPGDNNVRGNDIWGWIDPENGDEYAIAGLSGGTSFVRITDPENPVTVGFIYTATGPSTWRDMKVIGNFVYIVSEASNHGLQVFDLTRLRGRNSVEYFEPDAVNNEFGQAHNIVANEETEFIYVVGSRSGSFPNICAGGLQIFDVSDPYNPRFVGCFGDDGYVHDAQCVVYHGPDTRYSGHEICFCFNEDSLTIVDVNDKDNMYVIAKSGYINVAYTHQGWVTEDHELLLLDDELDETDKPNDFTKTYVWDIVNLEDPILRSVYESSERSIDHNQYIIGDYTFQSNYESGLRILHINRETQSLSQVAYFDVHPSRTTAEFNGAWSVFPYYPSGNVVIQSINYGMFVARPNWGEIKALVNSELTYAEQSRIREVLAVEKDVPCPPLVQSKVCSIPVDC